MKQRAICPKCDRGVFLVEKSADGYTLLVWRKHRNASSEVCKVSHRTIVQHPPVRLVEIATPPPVKNTHQTKWTPEARARLSATRKAMFQDPEFRERQTQLRRESEAKPEVRAKRLAAAQAIAADPVVRAKHAASWKDPEIRARRMEGIKNQTRPPLSKEHCAKISQRSKELWQDPLFRTTQLEHLKERAANTTPEVLSARAKAVWDDPTYREKMRPHLEALHTRNYSDEERSRISERAKAQWKDPDYRSKTVAALREAMPRRKKRSENQGATNPIS